MEFVGIAVSMTLLVLLFSYIANNDCWQTFNNSKFIDELLNEEKENESVFSIDDI